MTINHPHFEKAKRAYYNLSFVPEKRASEWCQSFDETMQEMKTLGINDAKIERWESLTLRHLNVQSRCASTMIVGPAKFPVAKAEKANMAERKAANIAFDYYQRIVEQAKKEIFYKENPDAKPIMAGDSDAIARLEKEIATATELQNAMKIYNESLRKGTPNISATIQELATKEGFKNGFPSFRLKNNLAEIKRLQARLFVLKKAKETGTNKHIINGVKIVENTEIMRLQLFFDGKPEKSLIEILKNNAFKWAPSLGAWQRQLTENAKWTFQERILPMLKA